MKQFIVRASLSLALLGAATVCAKAQVAPATNVKPKVEVTAPTQGQVFVATVVRTPSSETIYADVTTKLKVTFAFTGTPSSEYRLRAAISIGVASYPSGSSYSETRAFPAPEPNSPPTNAPIWAVVSTDADGTYTKVNPDAATLTTRLGYGQYHAKGSVVQSVATAADGTNERTGAWEAGNGFAVVSGPPPSSFPPAYSRDPNAPPPGAIA